MMFSILDNPFLSTAEITDILKETNTAKNKFISHLILNVFFQPEMVRRKERCAISDVST